MFEKYLRLNLQDSPLMRGLAFLKAASHRQRLPLWLFLGLCCNLILAPAVLAATQGSLTRSAAYALGLLGLVTLGLSGYLFVVIFEPERF